jgi:pyridoxamine 5'-phosphate oxidase
MSLISKLRAILTLGQGMTAGLSELTAAADPIVLFNEWFEKAKDSGIFLPDAIALATATPDGTPSARMMLLKGADDSGFVFYTNYESRKAAELFENPRAAMIIHWPTLQRQVRVEGLVERLSAEESYAYFKTRPRGSRIGAWASRQSSPLPNREELVRRFREYESKFAGGDVPLPDFWGGFRIKPSRIEFWQGRFDRLHDRLSYTPADGGWEVTRLYP